MKMKSLFFVMMAFALGATGLMAHKTVSTSGTHLHGTSLFHRYLKTGLTQVGDDPGSTASGQVQIKHNQQGRADREQMMIKVSGLEGDATFHLLAWIGDDLDPMELTLFTTSSSGQGAVKYMRKLQGNAAAAKGAKKFDLPNLEDPVDDIRRLVIADDAMNHLLEADLEAPDQFQYLIKRELTNDGLDQDAEGAIHLKAHHNQARFRLRVGGLDPDTDYSLAANGEVLETVTTDENGGFETTTILDVPLDLFLLDTLSVRNGDDQSVLSTSFPRP